MTTTLEAYLMLAVVAVGGPIAVVSYITRTIIWGFPPSSINIYIIKFQKQTVLVTDQEELICCQNKNLGDYDVVNMLLKKMVRTSIFSNLYLYTNLYVNSYGLNIPVKYVCLCGENDQNYKELVHKYRKKLLRLLLLMTKTKLNTDILKIVKLYLM